MARATICLLVAALVLGPAAFASHPSWFLDRKANLDADRMLERISAEYEVTSDHRFERATIGIIDNCKGRVRQFQLALPGRWMNQNDIVGPRVLGRRALLFTLLYRDGHVIARVVQLRPKRRGACPTPAALFAYTSRRPPYPPPRGWSVRGAHVDAAEYAGKFAGRELLLIETYFRTGTSEPVKKIRQTYFRYANAKRRYVPYRTEVTRLA
jgi:hypothetical protein